MSIINFEQLKYLKDVALKCYRQFVSFIGFERSRPKEGLGIVDDQEGLFFAGPWCKLARRKRSQCSSAHPDWPDAWLI